MNLPIIFSLFSGDITVKMPTTPLRVYSICLQKKDTNKVKYLVKMKLKASVIYRLLCNYVSCCSLVDLEAMSTYVPALNYKTRWFVVFRESCIS
jgi:hypothetical protein